MAARFGHSMPFGAELTDESVRFRFWAPAQDAVGLVLDDGNMNEFIMEASDGGWFELSLPADLARPGALYRYRLTGGLEVSDPASRFQPMDVHGPSQIVDPRAYLWRHDEWRGRPWEETVLYELHTGAFTEAGTFDGVRERLDHLAATGVTALEIMPIADFESLRNWGYDGVLPFAPESAYGTPESLKRLIDEAHGRGLMVFLDVVYNHFGPSGNYLHHYAPEFFTGRHRTPWGAAINFDDRRREVVRSFFIHNALYWLEEFCFDGLRFDAVHAIRDDSDRHILEELAGEVRAKFGSKRMVHLVLENDDNAAHFLRRDAHRRTRLYDAQWNDDFHHAAHIILTGETDGYYSDYAAHPIEAFGRALAEGFAYQGERSAFRGGLPRGEPTIGLPPAAFVSFLQNHDQIGNRAFGERLSTLADSDALRALHAILLLAPQIPMLFMGEEWGARSPFLFFCDFTDELAAAVRDGRRREFASFPKFRDSAARERIPDPNAIETFLLSRLDWSELNEPAAAKELELVRTLLALRQKDIVPLLADGPHGNASFDVRGTALNVRWSLGRKARLHLVANLSPDPADRLAWTIAGSCVYASSSDLSSAKAVGRLAPWSVLFTLEERSPAQ